MTAIINNNIKLFNMNLKEKNLSTRMFVISSFLSIFSVVDLSWWRQKQQMQ